MCITALSSQGRLEQLTARLQRTLFQPYSHRAPSLTLYHTEGISLSTQLSVVRAMQWTGEDVHLKMYVRNYAINQDCMQALAGLPESRALDVSSCSWPLESATYTQLAEVVPASFCTWFVGSPAKPVVDAICAGINAGLCRAGPKHAPAGRKEPGAAVRPVCQHTLAVGAAHSGDIRHGSGA